jgi:hypothetical protein
MNPNLKLVRDRIAEAPEHMTDMSTTGMPACGSPGCIIGWAQSLSPELVGAPFHTIYAALGLDEEQGNNLSLGLAPTPLIAQNHITKDEVLTAIDSLLVDPTRVMPKWPNRVRSIAENWS